MVFYRFVKNDAVEIDGIRTYNRAVIIARMVKEIEKDDSIEYQLFKVTPKGVTEVKIRK